MGLSPLSFARNAIGVGLATENRVSKIMANGAKPSGVLKTGEILKPDQKERVRQNFRDMAEGSNDSLFVLEGGFEYQQISMSPKDIELIASRRFQIEDIARFFGVPSVMINDTAASTTWGSGIEQIVQGFYKLGLRPYLERIEASINFNLIPEADRGLIFCEFDFNALLRADLSARLKTYKEAVTGGIMTPNEARGLEGWVEQEGGDDLYMQQQQVPLRLLTMGEGLSGGKSPAPDGESNLNALFKGLSDAAN
jgi:HK97 family phage portal protein